MAQKVKLGVGVVVDGEREFKKALSSINSEYRVLTSEMKKVTAEFSGNANSVQALTEKDRVLNEQIDKQKEKVATLKEALEHAKKEFGENDTRTDSWKVALNSAETQLHKLNSELKTNSKYLDEAKSSTDNMAKSIDGYGRDVKEAEEATSDFKEKLSAIVAGGAILEGLDAIRGKIVDVTSETMGFSISSQKAANDFAASTGVSVKELSEYKKQMKEVYADNFGEDMSDISGVMSEIKQQCKDIDASNIKAVTENAITLRDTFDMDIKEQMRAVNMLMEQFGITSDEAFNLISQGAQNGLNKNDDLLDSINEYAVHYKQLGADAEGFFNSLANGTESGTFSVDKLGDAYKEFGIRVKDTASSTVEGFELLGYHSGTPKEQVEKLNTTIDNLEKKLKYAKKEQEGFNSKTSELTRMKNADKIKEYSAELGKAKKELADIQKNGNDSSKSIKNLQARFAEGGESAKAATQEVIQKLFDMDDKVKQNQAGVDLFGTMWEDLGKDGVKALLNMEGQISLTKDSLEDIKEVKYDDLESAFEGIKRSLTSDISEPIEKEALPRLSEFAEKLEGNSEIGEKLGDIASDTINTVINGADFMFSHIDEVKTAVTGLVLAFVAVKAANAFSSTASSVIEMKNAIDAARASQTALNIAQKANIVGAVTGVVIGLGTAIATLAAANNNAASSTDGLTEKQRALIKESKEANKEVEQSLSQAKDRAQAIGLEFDGAVKLKDMLIDIIDKNGKIKKGYKERAEIIAGQLNKKLGTNLEITKDGQVAINGQIKKQKELNKVLDKTITKRRTERLLSSMETQNAEDRKNLVTAREKQVSLIEQIKAKKEEIKQAEEEAGEARRKANEADDFANPTIAKGMDKEAKKAEGKLKKLKEGLKNLQDDSKNTSKTIRDLSANIANYEQLDKAMQSGSKKRMKEAIFAFENQMKTAKNATLEDLAEQKKTTLDHYNTMAQAVKDGTVKMTDEQLNIYKKVYDRAAKEYDKKAKKVEKSTTETTKKVEKVGNEGKKKAKKVGNETSKAYGDGVASGEKKVRESTKTVVDGGIDEMNKGKSKAKTAGKNFINGFFTGTTGRQSYLENQMRDLAKQTFGAFNDELKAESKSTKKSALPNIFAKDGDKPTLSKSSVTRGAGQVDSYRRSLMSQISEINHLSSKVTAASTPATTTPRVIQESSPADIGSGDLHLSVNVAGKPLFDTVYSEFRKAKTRDPNISLS